MKSRASDLGLNQGRAGVPNSVVRTSTAQRALVSAHVAVLSVSVGCSKAGVWVAVVATL